MKITDLSHVFSIDDAVFPGTQPMSWERTHTCERDGYNLTMCRINSHAGTHTDAPLHFLADGKPLDQVGIERYVGDCYVVDCRKKGYANAMIEREDVEPFEKKIRRAGRLILATGWNKEFHKEYFFTAYPSVSLELAKYLAGLKIKMLGVEGPSVNTIDGANVHKVLLGADIAIVEALTNTETLAGKRIFFCGAPIAFSGMDGFPLRAYAIER